MTTWQHRVKLQLPTGRVISQMNISLFKLFTRASMLSLVDHIDWADPVCAVRKLFGTRISRFEGESF